MSLLFLPEGLSSYGKFEVGRPLYERNFLNQVLVTPGRSPKYAIYYFDKHVGIPCTDCNFETMSQKILDDGGGFAALDLKGAQSVGIPVIHNGTLVQLADSLMVIVDADFTVRGIYRNVSPRDFSLAIDVSRKKSRVLDRIRRQISKLDGILRQKYGSYWTYL